MQPLCKGLPKVNAATIHSGGEALREGWLFHRARPILFVFETAPVRRLICFEDMMKIFADRAILKRSVIRAEKPGRRADEMLARSFRQKNGFTVAVQEAHRDKESQHYIRRAVSNFELAANLFGGCRTFFEPREKIQKYQCTGQEISRVEAIPISVNWR